MLLEYGVQNFFGFKEGATISFKVPNKVSNVQGYAQIMCVKGKKCFWKNKFIKSIIFFK